MKNLILLTGIIVAMFMTTGKTNAQNINAFEDVLIIRKDNPAVLRLVEKFLNDYKSIDSDEVLIISPKDLGELNAIEFMLSGVEIGFEHYLKYNSNNEALGFEEEAALEKSMMAVELGVQDEQPAVVKESEVSTDSN